MTELRPQQQDMPKIGAEWAKGDAIEVVDLAAQRTLIVLSGLEVSLLYHTARAARPLTDKTLLGAVGNSRRLSQADRRQLPAAVGRLVAAGLLAQNDKLVKVREITVTPMGAHIHGFLTTAWVHWPSYSRLRAI